MKTALRWIWAMALEGPLYLGTLIIRLLPTLWSSKTLPGGEGRPILLVHGYLNNAWVWIFFKRKLAAAGLGPIYLVNLGFPFLSMKTYAHRVRKKAKKIARETFCKDLILIGHSMGGLVSALYATKLAPKGTVRDVILIASPIEGTPVAHIGLGPNAREMRKGSQLLQRMDQGISQTPDIRFYQIATTCDQIVLPGISAGRLVPPERRFIVDNLGHVSLLFSSRIVNQVAHWLSGT